MGTNQNACLQKLLYLITIQNTAAVKHVQSYKILSLNRNTISYVSLIQASKVACVKAKGLG